MLAVMSSFQEANIIGLKLDGAIDDEAFDAAIAAINHALDNNEKIRIYAEVTSIGGMSLETFFENIKVKSRLLRQVSQFEKEAIVSDKKWIETLIPIADKLFPTVEVRHFSFDEITEAQAWIRS